MDTRRSIAGVFVIGVSCWFLLRKRNVEMAMSSIKVAGWVGFAGILTTLATGDLSAVNVAKHQPMKLAAMEGLYDGSRGQELVAIGILNPDKRYDNDENPYLFHISIPKGLSFLATHDFNAFVPGINDLIEGYEIDENGETVTCVGYADRIAIGKESHEALRAYDTAMADGDVAGMEVALEKLRSTYKYFGYGYLDSPAEAIPPVAMTFYTFRIMVIAGGYLLLFFIVALFAVYYREQWLRNKVVQWIGMLSIVVVWVCSQSGWITAEVGRQPWVIQDLLPTRAAISDISSATVQVTFFMFAAVFTILLIAEISIMLSQINKHSKEDIETISKD